jgi:hypothetical protein
MSYGKPILGLALAIALEAQQSPQPAHPAPSPTPLERSMKSLQEKLGAIGQVNFSVSDRDKATAKTWVTQFSPEVARVRASAPDCRIGYDWRWVHNGRADPVRDMEVALKETEEIEVLPGEEVSREASTRHGAQQFDAHADPPIFVVRVDQPGADVILPFYDEALARRRRRVVERSRAVRWPRTGRRAELNQAASGAGRG